MTAAAIVRSAVTAGIRIRIDGDNLVLSAKTKPDAEIVRDLSSAKAEVIAYLRALALWAEDDWNALYDERAGIMEFDGGLPRAEAEAHAEKEVDLLRGLVRSSHG